MTPGRNSGGYAIVGIGCRFPGGANSPDAFWQVLAEGRDAIREVPEDRPDWARLYDPDPAVAGRIYVQRGGFIEDIDKFDARFFGISPREASRIDPQHRFLLETVWHAFEDARIPLHSLAGSDTGVFVGISTHDYGDVQMDPRHHDQIAMHTNSGCATSIAANRISYSYDLRGPSLSVDTACSSALTATHIACQALDAGDCDLAVIAGVQLLLRPELTMGFCKASMLSPDAACKAFDAAGNGYVRAEGAGVVVLKPLDAALADGNRIYAVVLGSAINQDGRTSSLTIPNEVSQRRMLETALARAGVPAQDVQYVEAHGPGTAVGDPIEARAIGKVFGAGRSPDSPVLIGSVKTNVGHLEAASGIAGLIKAALAVSHRQIPPSLHFNAWNPEIDHDGLNLRVVTRLQDWPQDDGVRHVAINSFGFGGANASVVLGSAPDPCGKIDTAECDARPLILPVSAQTPDALDELLRAYSALLADDRLDPEAICAAAALDRSHLGERTACVGAGREGLADALDAAIAGDKTANVARGRAATTSNGPVFVFSGMGPQWWGMGRQLLATEPVFRAMMERCDAALRPHSGWSLIDEFLTDEAGSRIAHPQLAQVSNFALQVSLAELWQSWGIRPGATIGHSGGAMAAAYLAGIHSLEDAIWLAYHRSQLQGRDSNAGEMLALGLPWQEAEALIGENADRISIAAINGPKTVTLSGDSAVLREIAQAMERKQVFARMLAVTIAYHSPRMDPIRDEFLETVAGLRPHKARLPFISDTTGTWNDGAGCDAQYWWTAIRQPVRFADSIRTLGEAGYASFIEIAPHPVLAASIGECMRSAGHEALVVPSLRRGDDERTIMLRSLATLYAHGAAPDWGALYQPGAAVPLPLYPFGKDRHWFEPEESAATAQGPSDANPLLGQRVPGANPAWEARLDGPALAWISDHQVQGAIIVPGAAYVAMALAASVRLAPGQVTVLRDLRFLRPLILREGQPRAQVSIDQLSGSFAVHSRSDAKAAWIRHATGRTVAGSFGEEAPVAIDEITARLGEPIDVPAFFEKVARRGLVYGPAFRGIRTLIANAEEALVTVGPVAGLVPDPDGVHPALLDAAFQALIAIADVKFSEDSRTFLPVEIEEVRLFRPVGASFLVHCRLEALRAGSATASFRICDEAGQVLLSVRRLTARLVNSGSDESDIAASSFYEYCWEPARLEPSDRPPLRPALLGLKPDDQQAMDAVCAGVDDITNWSEYYRSHEPLLAQAAAAHVLAALDQLGVPTAPGNTIDDKVATGIAASEPSGGLWSSRLFGLLEETGCLVRAENGWRVAHQPDLAELESRLPGYAIDFALLAQAGRTLAGALSGDASGRDAIFTAESLPLLAQFYREAPASDHYNRIMAGMVAQLADRAPAGGLLRILEIGAGTGGATAALLEVLPLDRVHYLFTDSAPLLLDAARAHFGEIEGIEFRTLDITQDLAAQRFTPGMFDLIVAANVVHATPDIAATLARIGSLLAPGGTLALLEITRHPRWLDVIFGQTRGWWAFADTNLRSEHPLLESGQWREQLAAAGYADITVSHEPGAVGEQAQSVILAGKPLSGAAARPPWLLLDSRSGMAERLALVLGATGCACEVLPTPAALLSRLAEPGFATCGIIDMRGTAPAGDRRAGAGQGVFAALDLTRALVASDRLDVPLWFVTAGAAQAPGSGGDADEAALIGFVRTLIKEYPDAAVRLADLGAAPGPAEFAGFARELSEPGREEELAFAGTARLVRRMRRGTADAPRRVLADQPLEWHAEIRTPGSLASLRLVEFRPLPPGPKEVRIRIVAASLNFRDVVLALGLIQDLEESDTSVGRKRLGSDCAGVVVEVGSLVTRFVPGDAVMGSAPAALGTMAVTREDTLVRMPEGLDFAAAAALPTVGITAWYALRRLGRLAKGETVLIHSAAGGVGQVAVAVAQLIGADIIATAGSESKREHLRSQGIAHVFDSRSLDFADEVAAATGGRGVDVVLNSLVGEAVDRSLACLAPYGRFIEIGKADIYANNEMRLGAFRRNLTFSSFDLDRLAQERPGEVGEALAELVAALCNGAISPVPFETYPMARMEDAFRQMALGQQIGKIVLVNDGVRPPLPSRAGIDCHLRSAASYLVTGGLGGFGLTIAEHLAKGRPGAIVLMGRNPPSADAARRLHAIGEAGTRVVVIQGDVADAGDLARVLASIDRDLPPLRGVFHGAMVLDDQRFATMDEASLERVLRPKAAGAWNLHEATKHLPLDHFVMFSSITSLLGNPLQANYAAANAVLDALAHQRQRSGLAGLTINWGVLAGVGYVAERPELQRFLDQQGYLSFTPADALAAFDEALSRTSPEIMAARIDWGQLASYSPRSASSPRLAHLVPRSSEQTGGTQPGSAIVATLSDTAAGERPAVIQAFLATALARILGMSADAIDIEQPLDGFGLDSLLSVEFMVILSGDLSFEMPVIALLDDMSVRRLGDLILADFAGRSYAAPAAAPVVAVAPVVAIAPVVAVAPQAAPLAPAPTLPVVSALPIRSQPGADWTRLQNTARGISSFVLAGFGDIAVEGLENLPDGPFILAVNHLSMADVPLALSLMPRKTIMLANDKLRRNWLLNRLVGGIGEAIWLPKSGDVGPALDRARGVLANGGIIALAPEGTRNRDGLGRAETGITWLARQAGVPVVPYAAWGQEQWRSRLRHLPRLPVCVRIGDPLAPPSGNTGQRDYADAVMQAIAALLPPQYRGVYGSEAAE